MYTVLMVENREIRDLLEAEFSRECIVREVKTLSDLLHSIKTEFADIVILDLDAPESRKQETLSLLQSFGRNSKLLFLAEESLFDPSHPLTAAAAADYLIKPCTDLEWILAMEEVIRACQKRTAAEGEESVRLSLVREKLQDYIRLHYGEDLSMQNVAQVMNYSETHFCRLFKQCFKVNFSAYLNEYRIRQAKEMLCSTNRNVKEIAFACGYQDTSYFIRVFKRLTNMTPADYRVYAQTMSRK